MQKVGGDKETQGPLTVVNSLEAGPGVESQVELPARLCGVVSHISVVMGV